MADEGVTLYQPLNPNCEGNGDYGRERFRDYGDRQRDPEDEHFNERLASQKTECNDKRDDDERRFCQHASDFVEVNLQGGFGGLDRLEQLGNLAELRLHCRRDHQSPSTTVCGHRPCISHVSSISERCSRVVERARLFGDRHRFSGQSCLLDLEVDRLHEPHVGGYPAARFDEDNVPGNQVTRGNLPFLPIAQHSRCRRGHFPQRLNRALGSVLLDETKAHGKQHDNCDGESFETVTQEGRKTRGKQENEDQDVLELIKKDRPGRDGPGGYQFVRPVIGQTAGGFRLRQSTRGGVQFLLRLLRGQHVPGDVRTCFHRFSFLGHQV